MNLDLSNGEFCAFMLPQFPICMDDEKEITLLDYLTENVGMPTNDILEKLSCQTYIHKLYADLTFYAEFRPMVTFYYFNEKYLGNSGGHFHLSSLGWQELKLIVSQESNARSPVFFILLPLAISCKEQIPEIGAYILQHLQYLDINLTGDQPYQVVMFLIRNLLLREE